MKPRVGIVTGGGDAPGLNGIIESSCRAMIENGFEVLGFSDGFEGIFSGRARVLTREEVTGAHAEAGTLLGTSNRSSLVGREAEFLRQYQSHGLNGLIVAGGDGTFAALSRVQGGLPVIGVPKTIDNDLSGTEFTFGFDTACSVISEAVDALRATADAHRRVFFVETMGRTAGWLALGGGLAAYADAILLPERPFARTVFLNFIQQQKARGKRGLLVVVAEGAAAQGESAQVAFRVSASPQPDRYGGIAESLARWVEREAGWEARHVVLGHLQRSRVPTVTDRFLTLSMGVEVAQMVKEGAWGQAVVYRQGRVRRAPITDLMQAAKLVDPNHRWVQMAQALGIFI